VRRIYHPWHKWECYWSGFFKTIAPIGIDKNMAIKKYSDFLSDDVLFQKAIDRVFLEWPISCEQFLSNESLNRIAWIGQAAMCIETSIPSCFRAGFKLLTKEKADMANSIADNNLKKWIYINEKKDT